MDNDDRWRSDFQELALALAERPRLRSSVMEQIESQSLSNMVEPAQRPARISRRTVVARMVAVGSSVAAVIMIAWLIGLSTPAFAQVQDAIRKIKTAIITREFLDQPGVNQRVLISRQHDLYRVEWSSGATLVQSREGRTLLLNTKEKLANIAPGAGFGLEGERLAPGDFLGRLESVETDAVLSLGTKTFDGRELMGFELPTERGMRRRVWVDPDSHLPVREDVDPAVPAHPNDDPRVVTIRPPQSTATYQFNRDLGDELFSLDKPDGYRLVDSNEFKWPGFELEPLPVDLDAASYVLIPGSGIGLARFGMSKQEVIDALGKPDETNLIGERSVEQHQASEQIERKAKEENWDKYRLERERSRLDSQNQSFVRTSTALRYPSLGFHVVIRDDTGLHEIMCWSESGVVRQFVGATDLGISMQSSPADVVQAYGEATDEMEFENGLTLYYEKLQLSFSFDGSDYMQTVHAIRPKQD